MGNQTECIVPKKKKREDEKQGPPEGKTKGNNLRKKKN